MEQAPDIPVTTLAERLPDVRKQRAVEGMRVHGTKAAAARFAKVDRRTVTAWWDSDPVFAEEMEEAYEEHCDDAEEELHARAVTGVEQVVYLKGEPVPKRDPDTGEVVLDDDFEPVYWTRLVKSDTLLPFYLKAKRAAYREKTDITLMGPGGGAVKTDNTFKVEFVERVMPSIEELEKMYGEKAQEARAATEG